MKKILFSILLVFSFMAFQKTKAQAQHKFYFYPNSNVYYDVANKHYIYSNNGNWQTVKILPSGIRVSNTPKVVVYHSTPKVWVVNPTHVVKYKNQPNGKAWGYKRNQAIGRGNGKSKHK